MVSPTFRRKLDILVSVREGRLTTKWNKHCLPRCHHSELHYMPSPKDHVSVGEIKCFD